MDGQVQSCMIVLLLTYVKYIQRLLVSIMFVCQQYQHISPNQSCLFLAAMLILIHMVKKRINFSKIVTIGYTINKLTIFNIIQYSLMAINGYASDLEVSCKKIQNYIFNFNDLLGQGNFSKVYKARNEVTNEIVAIKIVQLNSLKSKKLQQLLFSEIDILKRLKHENILKCYEVFTSNRNCYIITELCNEGDLESKLKAKRYFKQNEAETYIKDVYKGLLYLAENNVVHRDLKVANIFVHNGVAKIADFGFAKFVKSKFKDINIGSPIYMSPQGLIDNIYGPKTDIWSFGILIFQLLHGETPFSHCKSEKQLKHNMSIVIGWGQLKPELSTDIKEVIIKCLEIDENKRITAFDLKKLNYFKIRNQSPTKTSSEAQFKEYKSIYQISRYSPPYDSIGNNKSTNHAESRPNSKSRDNLMPEISTDRKIRLKTQQKFAKSKQFTPGKTQISKPYQFYKYLGENLQRQSSRQKPQGLTLSNKNFLPHEKKQQMKADPIISIGINFKQCVNILHYCRLIFKYLMLYKQTEKQQNQLNIFKRWLATILRSISRSIQEKRIIYEGDNIAARQKKLEEVTNEYIKKYTKQLSLDLKARGQESAIINYDKMCGYFNSIFQQIDNLIANKQSAGQNILSLGHFIIMICDSTKLLKRCYDEKNYKRIQRMKEVEDFLSLGKNTFNLSSYLWYRRKYLL